MTKNLVLNNMLPLTAPYAAKTAGVPTRTLLNRPHAPRFDARFPIVGERR